MIPEQQQAREELQRRHDSAFAARKVEGEDIALRAALYAVLSAPPDLVAKAAGGRVVAEDHEYFSDGSEPGEHHGTLIYIPREPA